MDKRKKLLELTAGAELRLDVDCSSPDRFLESGKRIEAEIAKMEALGQEHLDRIRCLMRLIVAEQLQPRALSKYGNASDSSLRQVLLDEFFKSEDGKQWWAEVARLAKEALRGQEFTDQQLEIIGRIFDNLPGLLIDAIMEEVRQTCLVPLAEGSNIAGVLCGMLKEAERYADDIRNN